MLMKRLALLLFIFALLFSLSAEATSSSSPSRHKRYPKEGGHYIGGSGKSHKGGYYSNPRTDNRYTRH